MNIKAMLHVPRWTISLFLKAMSPQVRPRLLRDQAETQEERQASGWGGEL
jgi:hypothetical protein